MDQKRERDLHVLAFTSRLRWYYNHIPHTVFSSGEALLVVACAGYGMGVHALSTLNLNSHH